jgi:hypothetical protein
MAPRLANRDFRGYASINPFVACQRRLNTVSAFTMSVSKLGDELGSLLHREFLKPMGFKKRGRSFFVLREEFEECYNIQGCSWNSGEEPWEFYLNVNVRFLDIPTIPGLKYHASGRSNGLLPGSPPSFEILKGSVSTVAAEVHDVVKSISERLSWELCDAHRRARQGIWAPLPAPPWARS